MVLGIDPGIHGGFAVLDGERLVTAGRLPIAGDMISGKLFSGIFDQFPAISEVVVERVNARPGEGVSSSFRFGRAVGIIEGVAAANDRRLVWVAPSVWKRALGLSKDKEQSRQRAIELWPEHANLAFRYRKDHGPAEAALIGMWRVTRA